MFIKHLAAISYNIIYARKFIPPYFLQEMYISDKKNTRFPGCFIQCDSLFQLPQLFTEYGY